MKITLKWPDSVPKEQFSKEFLQGMLDRMAMGFHNYGPISKNFPGNYNAYQGARRRWKTYRKNKNTEFLMDFANFAMIEFLHPSVKGASCTPTTKRESPGSVLRNGKIAKGKEDFNPDTDRI